jgi:hypothetical protein
VLLLLLQQAAGEDYTLTATGGSVAIAGGPVAFLASGGASLTISGSATLTYDDSTTLVADPYDVLVEFTPVGLQTMDFVAAGGSLVTTFPAVTLVYQQPGSSGDRAFGGGGSSRQPRGTPDKTSFRLREDLKPNELEDIYDRILGIITPDVTVQAAIAAVERVAEEKRPEPEAVDWQAVAADASAVAALEDAEDDALEALMVVLAVMDELDEAA